MKFWRQNAGEGRGTARKIARAAESRARKVRPGIPDHHVTLPTAHASRGPRPILAVDDTALLLPASPPSTA